ncbi:ribonuclease T2-like [Apophysomyces sp. BC1034]|nr:ribonuclease T2-like [Apophysomyces sp. BC1034]
MLLTKWITDYGPPDAFTLHGLWPDTCNGGQTGNSGCDSSRAYSDVGSIIQSGNPSLYNQMNTYWPSYKGDNSEFWTHEWDKHGTCVSTLDPSCFGSSYEQYEDMYTYFGQVLELRQKYDLYSIFSNANITPGDGSVSISDLESAIQSSIGVQPKISCHDGAINEVWIYFNVQGPNTYVPIDSVESSTCSGSTTYPSKNS